MTRQEFFAARTRLLEGFERQAVASIAVAFAALVVSIPLFLQRRPAFPPLVRLAGLLSPVLIGFVAPLVFRHRALVKARRLGIVCSKCGENLLLSWLVGDRCPNCNTVIFPEASTAVLPSILEFHDRLIALDARNDPLILAVGVPVSIAAAGFLGEQLYQRLGIPEPAWFLWTFAAVFIVGVTTAPILYQWRLGVLAGRLGLDCPNCHRPVVGGQGDSFTQYTLRTRKCPECGSPVMN
jgi:Zn finger protein HypA/HybF involved in hydrogenase expression